MDIAEFSGMNESFFNETHQNLGWSFWCKNAFFSNAAMSNFVKTKQIMV